MEKKDIEELRSRVPCAAVLQKAGFAVDLKESTRKAVKYRRGDDIVIVIYDGKGWFDARSKAKGDVFSLVMHLDSIDFAEATQRVSDLVGFVPSEPAWTRQARERDPRALKDNPDRTRKTKSTAQADALLLATIKAVGIVQPPVIAPETAGGNGYIINAGHRRVKQAIAAGLEEIEVLVDEAANDNGAMRSIVENIAREPLNPVDQWRAIERLVALGWTEEAIGVALALPVRQIKKLRLLANVLPAMLDHMAKGDMPNEKQLRTIAAASLDEQREVWKKHKPSKADPQVAWYSVANGLEKTRMYAKDASFDDELAKAYGIAWVEDLFASADEDSRYTTNVEAFLGAQQEWMSNHLPKRGVIVEADTWGRAKLPPKAERVYGKPGRSDHIAMFVDREGKVQTVHYRMPEPKTAKGKAGTTGGAPGDDAIVATKPRPDVTRRGIEMVGDFRTDALHEALARAPIDDNTRPF